MVSAIEDPFIFGCLALYIAGYKVDELDGDILANQPNDGFRLVFGINEHLTLSMSYDKESSEYIVVGSIPDGGKNAALLEMALKLNFVLLEQRRSFSIDPGSEGLVLTQLVGLERLELESLAEAIADVTQTVLALNGYDFGSRPKVRDTEPVDWGSVVRG